MARYAIDQSGIDSLVALRNNLNQSVEEISACTVQLINSLDGLENDLGIYYKEILLESEKVLYILKKALDGDDGIRYLINTKLPTMISYVEMLVAEGLVDDGGPQKVLRR